MIRPARPSDVPTILQLIGELATYEKEPDAVRTTTDDLAGALFAHNPSVFCHVAQEDTDGPVVGFALWFVNFSTWTGRHGIYLEDLFVRPDHRGGGHGRALLIELARLCAERGYGRLEWSVLDWNTPAQGFYRSLGAAPMDDWTVWRMTQEAITSITAP